MKIKICIAYIFGLIVIGTLCGCGTSANKTEPLFEELDVDYTANDDGTYTYKGNIYKYKSEVSGMEGEAPVTFIVLTNDTETSFEDISYSLKKAEISTGIPEFVVLGWHSLTPEHGDTEKSVKKAEEALTDHLVSSGTLKSGMQLEDGRSMMWEEMCEREIAGTQCYVFELRFSEDEDVNGIMAGRLFGSYAVSKDGKTFYRYNPADDTWEQMPSDV